jgi:hypothetical protein
MNELDLTEYLGNQDDAQEMPSALAALLSALTGEEKREPETQPLSEQERSEARDHMLRLSDRFLDGALSISEMRRDDLVGGFEHLSDELSSLAGEFTREENSPGE